MKRAPAVMQVALLFVCAGVAAGAELSDCLPDLPVALTVRIGAAAPVHALLRGGDAPALQVIDAQSGAPLWSAGAAAPVTQRFAAMSAPFAGSLIALDTDGDGLDDRLYAGDLAGRLWRFDLHNGAPAGTWASGGVFADFSNDAGRMFLAPPDVALMSPPGAAPWFSIALGTAAPGRADADNRFYVLRDTTPFASWSDAQYHDWQPLHESDLARVAGTSAAADGGSGPGWFVALGGGDVLGAALTASGRTVFAIADSLTGCRSAFSLATLDLAQRRLVSDASGAWRAAVAGELPLGTSFALIADTGGVPAGTARCQFGDVHVADCDVDLRPHRTWWRREDAE